jgi:hypothetical protein
MEDDLLEENDPSHAKSHYTLDFHAASFSNIL